MQRLYEAYTKQNLGYVTKGMIDSVPNPSEITIAEALDLLQILERVVREKVGQMKSEVGTDSTAYSKELFDVFETREKELNDISIALCQLKELPDQGRGLNEVYTDLKTHLIKKEILKDANSQELK